MPTLTKGRYRARTATGPGDIRAAQRLRQRAFRRDEGLDSDAYDAACTHVLLEDRATGALVCCFRLLPIAGGRTVSESYAAQFYDLSALSGFDGPMLELGRFCIHPDWHDPDILRVAWGALTGHVDRKGVRLLFGCSSFQGTDAAPYAEAFALLCDRHLAPARWRPGVKAPEVVRYCDEDGAQRALDKRRARALLPPLLRSYLLMGGWVSDHAVIDRDLGTLHVFTGLEIDAVPPARARLLRAVAG
ncbi:MAG: ornithine-acyl-ACP acyltransferase [Rhodobacteraceae bacterium CG17_big_fil_post_rev_8_21_14_2_50_65_11]|nr:MAG: ornithine-acyl-ACP acyltransferase [Rhodobacteraceae bacterium CG17_big_fil_post_rev_8_21_14_2_50_65_11]